MPCRRDAAVSADATATGRLPKGIGDAGGATMRESLAGGVRGGPAVSLTIPRSAGRP